MDIMQLHNLIEKLKKQQQENFKNCEFKDLKEGDIVMTVTMTYSQKYFLDEQYKEYNMIKKGILLSKDETDNGNSKILQYEIVDGEIKFIETNLYSDPKTSGMFIIYKYYDDPI